MNGISQKKVHEAKKMPNFDLLHRYFMSRLEKTNGFNARRKESFVNINISPEKFRSRLNGVSEKKVREAKKFPNVELLRRYFMSRLE